MHTHTCTHARRSQQIKLVKGGAGDEPEGSKQVIYVDRVLPAITLAYIHASKEPSVYDAIAATPYLQVRAHAHAAAAGMGAALPLGAWACMV